MRVVLDTNVITSGSISASGAPGLLLSAWEDKAFELFVSPPLLTEYRRTLDYERVRSLHKKNDEQIDEQVGNYARFGTLVEITAEVEGVTPLPCR